MPAGPCFAQANPPAAPAKAQEAKPPAASGAAETIPPAAANALFPAVVARVDGKAILGRDLENQVRQELTSIGSPEWKNLRGEYRGELFLRYITALINSRLLYQAAAAAGVKVSDAEVQAEMQNLAKSYRNDAEMNAALAAQNIDRTILQQNLLENLTMAKYVEENVNKKITVTQEELAKYYSGNPEQFHHPDIVRTSHILIRPTDDSPEQDVVARERAEALLARVKKGEDFAKLARENSVDASASRGGDMGFATREAMGDTYADAAFALPIGGVQLVKTQYGYHVLRVTEKKKEGLATLEEVKEELTDYLRRQKSQEALDTLVRQLREKAKVEILLSLDDVIKS